MPQKLLAVILFLVSVGFVAAQNPSDPKKTDQKTDEAAEKLKKEAVAFLRETMAEVNAMRSLENRLSFGAEMASVMWLHDEKEARAMYMGVTADFRQLLVDLNTQLEAIALAETTEEETPISYGLFGDSGGKSSVDRKLRQALEMRKQIAMSLAEHEPDMALAFYYDSVTAITNKELLGNSPEQDSHFELQLMAQVAESNAAKAAQYGAKSLDKGVNHQHLELLKKIYAKDADKGIEFASAIVGKIKSSKSDVDLYLINSLVNFAEETAEKKDKAGAKKPVMTAQDIRDVVEIMASSLIASNDEHDMSGSYMSLFEKYTPTRASQIKSKFRSTNRIFGNAANAVANVASNSMMPANMAAMAANSAAAAENSVAERKAKALEEKIEAERKLMEEVANMNTKPLPKDERSKIVTQARKIISQTPGKDKKIMGLSLLASQVAKAGDKELAAEIMKDAESLVTTQPKNYQDYLLKWMLISGYAEVDTEKAFPMLTDTIFRLNDTISAFIKAAEFIDATGEMISDGEVQVGQFGGSMLRSLTKELKIAEPTLRSLAKSDFAKTKAVTNTFDRTEVRVLAKMMVLRTILDTRDKSEKQDPNIGLVLN